MQEFALVMSCVSAAVAGLFAYLQNRDKLRYDVKLVGMQTDIDTCNRDRDGLRSDITRLKAELAAHVGSCDAHKP